MKCREAEAEARQGQGLASGFRLVSVQDSVDVWTTEQNSKKRSRGTGTLVAPVHRIWLILIKELNDQVTTKRSLNDPPYGE